MSKLFKIHSRTLCTFSGVLFLSLFLILSYFNRPATDDFHFMHNVHSYGILEGMLKEYQTWSPRYAAVLVTHLLIFIEEANGWGYFLFGIISILLVIFSIRFFVTQVIELLLQNGIQFNSSKKTRIGLTGSLFIASVWFFSSLRIGETWFWLCSASTYLWSNAFFLLLMGSSLKSSKSSTDLFLILLCACYIGGSCGPLSITTLVLLLILIANIGFNRIATRNKRWILLKLISGLLLLSLAFYFHYIASGNRIRETFFQEISVGTSFLLNIKMTVIILIKRLPLSFIIYLILTLPLFPLIKSEEVNYSKWFRSIAVSGSIYIGLIFLFQWSITFKTQDVGAYRTLFFVSTLSLLFCAHFWMQTARYGIIKKVQTFVETVSKGVLSIYVVLLLILLVQQTYIARRYSIACDDRITYCLEICSKEKKLITLNPLPPSGMLYSAELSSDSSYFSNLHFRQGLKLGCSVRINPLPPE